MMRAEEFNHGVSRSFTEFHGEKSQNLLKTPCYSAVLIFFAFLAAGCAGMVQKGGELLEGTAFEEKTLALYQSVGKAVGKDNEEKFEIREMLLKDGQEVIEITSSKWPGLAIRGSMPGAGGNMELRELRFLSSHVYGWNEFSLDLVGTAVFSVSGKVVGLLRIPGEVERVQISSGRIRLKSSRLTGAEALTSLRNRRERILAVTEWMRQSQQTGLQEQSVFASQKEFENYWKPRLFPELVSGKKRPSEYTAKNAEWGRADSVRWNRSYTKILFPEELWELRNSGALLRDWEEALPWIYMEYSWNDIISTLNYTNFIRVE